MSFLRKLCSLGKDKWSIGMGVEEGRRLVLRIRNVIPPQKDLGRYPFLINIYWKYHETEKNGFPLKMTQKRMYELEDRLQPIEGHDVGFFMLSLTGNQRKEWVWYTRDDKVFLERLNQALAGLPPFPIEIHIEKDPFWSTYKGLLYDLKKKPRE